MRKGVAALAAVAILACVLLYLDNQEIMQSQLLHVLTADFQNRTLLTNALNFKETEANTTEVTEAPSLSSANFTDVVELLELITSADVPPMTVDAVVPSTAEEIPQLQRKLHDVTLLAHVDDRKYHLLHGVFCVHAHYMDWPPTHKHHTTPHTIENESAEKGYP